MPIMETVLGAIAQLRFVNSYDVARLSPRIELLNVAETSALPDFKYRFVPPAHIRDGLSNMVMIGERQVAPTLRPDIGGATWWCQDDNEYFHNSGWDSDVIRGGGTPPAPNREHPCETTQRAGSARFGSQHASGCGIAMADGSVHTVGWDIDAATFRNLCTRSDGNPAALP